MSIVSCFPTKGDLAKLTGSQGQFVGFTADNVVGAVDAPAGLPSGGTTGQMLYQGESGPEWGDKPVMRVNVTMGAGSVYSADKSSTEIYQAYQSGYWISASFGTNMGLLVYSDAGLAVFLAFDDELDISVSVRIVGDSMVDVSPTGLQASAISLSPATTGFSATNVQDAIEEVNGKIPSAPKSVSITLPASGWSSNTQTVTVQGVLADESAQLIQPMPAAASQNAYISAGVICSGQAANQLSFTCSTTPTEDISLYVVLTEVSA